MAISIIAPTKDPTPWLNALKAVDAYLEVQVWPHEDTSAVELALCWQHPPQVWSQLPNLRCISSMGAGVDHLLADELLPTHIPIVRLVDPLLAQSMFEYICTAVMYYFRAFDVYQAQQRQGLWQEHAPQQLTDITIGILGLGALGSYTAQKLSALGFNVMGWSRSAKNMAGVRAYAGDAQLPTLLAQTNILVCLLPLTAETTDILNRALFNQLPPQACLINVARGEHLVETDLIAALDSGQLRGAYLDVLRQEPLPPNHPF